MILLWVLVTSGIVIGFQAFLKVFTKSSDGDVSKSLHPIRRLQHVFTGVIIVVICQFFNHNLCRVFITVPTLGFFAFDIARRKYFPQLNKWFLSNWSWLLRPHEIRDRPPAALFFLCGVSFVFWFSTSKANCVLGVLFLSICDPAASTFGILIGGVKIRENKSLAGTFFAGVFGFLITFFVFSVYDVSLNPLIGFVIAVVSEVISFERIDDNLSIPVISCVLWELVFRYTGTVLEGLD